MIFNIYFFQFEDYRIGKFSNNINFRKLDFLSEEKISEPACFVNLCDFINSMFLI